MIDLTESTLLLTSIKGISATLRKKFLIRNINLTGQKKCMLPMDLSLPEDTSHHSALVLEVQDFSHGLLLP